MPSSVNVNAGDPIKASQYNSLITDMTAIEADMATLNTDLTADMTTLETNVNNDIANLEGQMDMLLLKNKVTLKSLNSLLIV